MWSSRANYPQCFDRHRGDAQLQQPDAGTGSSDAGDRRVWGNGTISGGATIDAGGRLAPGTSIGTMAAAGDLTINGTYEVEVTDPANDSLAVSGI